MDLLEPTTTNSTDNQTAHLFSPLKIRGVTLKNRIMVSPMCMYSSEDGFANDWHMVHLGALAVGGAGLVFTEATAVEPRGRIAPQDLGIWDDRHVEMLARIATFMKAYGAVTGMQLAHAGRKASMARPWDGGKPVGKDKGGWPTEVVGPSATPFDSYYPTPHELTTAEIAEITEAFVAGAERAIQAGFEVLEIHAGHGYLLHEFLSPAANKRTDEYGGSLENRARFLLELVGRLRQTIPAEMPLFVRISGTDWLPDDEPRWTLDDSVTLAKLLGEAGVDLVDASSSGASPRQQIKAFPGYQVPLAERIRQESGILTAAVGLISEPEHADSIVRLGQADLVALARELLRNPRWPLQAAKALGHDIEWPDQYARAKL